MPTDADNLGPMATEVARSLKTLPANSGDAAAKALAMEYAAAIDTDGPLSVYGPMLLSALTALRLTPATRTAVKEASTSDSTPAGALARLRQGANGAPHLHSAPTGTDA